MDRRDVSFTFTHRIEEVESNIEDGRWQSALALALTLPDICGAIAFPHIVKKYRDGRVMLDRQKNPTRDVGSQYIKWFDEYATDFFKIDPSDLSPYISGERCWQLRCEYLHQNKGFVNEEDPDEVRFHLGVNCGTSVCQMETVTYQDGNLDIRIDIEQFCLRMCHAARAYYNQMKKEKDFSMYNTPVLDFVETKKKEYGNPMIAILCSNESYGKGLKLVLRQLSDNIVLFSSSKEAKKELGKKKPFLWIITEMIEKNEEPLWEKGKKAPVIFIGEGNTVPEENREAVSMPVQPDVLRNLVEKYLE